MTEDFMNVMGVQYQFNLALILRFLYHTPSFLVICFLKMFRDSVIIDYLI